MDKYAFYITSKMSQKNKLLKKCKFNADEALNIIISEEYTLGTSSSNDSSSESSYSDKMNDTNSQAPSLKLKKRKKIQRNTTENDMFYEHVKCHFDGVSQTHVQPTSNILTVPQASKKSDTSSTVNYSHDNSQLPHFPDTVQTDTTTEELVVSIPIHFEVENPENEETAIDSNNLNLLQPQSVNQNPEEIEFPPEYFTNRQEDVTSSDNDNEEDDYIIKTENNQTPDRIQYPIVNYERNIDLQEDIDNGWIRVDNPDLVEGYPGYPPTSRPGQGYPGYPPPSRPGMG